LHGFIATAHDGADSTESVSQMDVRDAVASRYSCRSFLPKPVPEAIVRDIVEGAARAPSAGNLQPWRVHALAGEKLAALKANLAGRSGELPKGEGGDYRIYPDPMGEPYRGRAFKVGELLYESIGVARADKPGRYRQYARNYQFFDAPVGLFVATEKRFGLAQWADIGGYLQTVMLLARGHGLHTCPQQAWVAFHKTVRAHLALPEDWMVYSGLSLGYENPDAAINRWRAPRESPDAFAVFEGFDD
jgi:nitroreductase